MAFFIVIAVKTSNPTNQFLFLGADPSCHEPDERFENQDCSMEQ
jgi:hypothetical protein